MALTQQHRLRAYDAVQLATAIAAAAVLPGLAFVAADNDLLDAAQAEGLTAENPNNYADDGGASKEKECGLIGLNRRRRLVEKPLKQHARHGCAYHHLMPRRLART